MRNIYNQNKRYITNLKCSIAEFRKQNINLGLAYYRSCMNEISVNVIEVIKNKNYFNDYKITVNEAYIMEVLSNITNALNQKDYILLADLMELQLIPMLVEWQETIQSKEMVIPMGDRYNQNIKYLEEYDKELAQAIRQNPEIAEGYEIEPTTNGSLTIKVIRDGEEFYLISNNDPENVGKLFADTYYNPRKSNYILFGMELLNHANALIENKNVECVKVYEADLNIIKLAARYADFKHLITNRLLIYYDPDYVKFSKDSKEDTINNMVVMHQPSIRNIKNKKVKERFERIFLVDSSIRNQGDWMISNFMSNIKHCNHYVDELLPKFQGKDVYIIAAGPSLDKNIALLKKKPENSLILTVGTVHRKLVNMGIKPDFTIFSDANKIMTEQMEGLKDYTFPMLMLSTAYRELATMNDGDKYLICQYDYQEAEEYAKRNHYHLYQSGGSVTTTALDVSIRLKALRVIFLGADMANTNNLTHAMGTAHRDTMDTKGLFPVESVDGGFVYTTRILNMYREWIENRIKDEKEIEFIDATEGGALIKGTKVCQLSKIINEATIKKKD